MFDYLHLLAAAGLIGKAIFDFSQNNVSVAIGDVMAALAVFGIHLGMNKMKAHVGMK